MPIVVVKSKDGSRSYLLEEGRPMFIGRAKECDILLPSPAVSRRHAVILYKNGICGIKDLGSFNGTLLNDHPIGEPRHMTENDTVRISSFILRLHLNAPDAASAAPAPAMDGNFEATVDLSMHSILQPPAKPKSVKPDSTRYSSTIRLPRAMRQDDEEQDAGPDALIGAISRNARQDGDPTDETHGYIPGGETLAFINNERTAEDGPPPAEETNVLPPQSGGDGDRDDTRQGRTVLPGPDDTAYFREPPLPPESRPHSAANTDDTREEVIDPGTGEVLSSAEAEAVIPLLEPEVAPTLTLEEDRATNEALERLIEDLPTYKREKIDGVREIAAEPSPPTDALPPAPEAFEPETGELPAVEQQAAFNPETGEHGSVSRESGSSGRFAPIEGLTPSADAVNAEASRAGLETIPVSQEFMDAINTRLSLYALLADLSEERRLLRMGGLPRDVEEELNRQDAEMDSLPTAEEAQRMANALRAERENDAREGRPAPTEAMRAAEEMAVSQWLLVRDSNLEALPAVYKEAYRLVIDEPLAVELTREQIAHGRLLGGAAYLLALEALALTAAQEKTRISTRIRQISDEGSSGVLSKLGKLGKLANNLKNRTEIRERTTRLEQEHKNHSHRAELVEREIRFVTKTLIREFRHVYANVALHYIGRSEVMPIPVRAFLRYGAVGFKPWWMREELKNFILDDCGDNIVAGMDRSRDGLNILYADEYLIAVAEMECSPFPDESLAELERNAVELKTDRAYRRIVNARTYNELMERMLSDLDVRMKTLDDESAALEERIATAKNDPTAKKEAMFDLQTEHQAVAIRKSNLEKHVKRIEKEVVSSIIDAVQEAEGRFRKGELAMPTREFLIAREVAALFDNCRRMEGKREQFMPMALRSGFPLDKDMINVRGALRVTMTELETLDPGVFMNVIIPARKKINRVELRHSPVVVILPVAGQMGVCSMGREGMEGGHLALPACFVKENTRRRQLVRLLADFRWETSRNQGGRDIMNSDTLAGAFMRIRWEWRNAAKTKREKGMIFNDNNDKTNWQRVYELYLSDAMSGGKQLFLRNPDCYNAIIGKFIDPPQGVPLLRRSPTSPE